MGREKRIKIEPVMMHDDSSEKIHPCSDTPETEKRLVEYQQETHKLMEVKAEPGTNYFKNQITELTKKLSELQKQVLEKDRAVAFYRDRLQVLETKVGELEEEKWMDNQIIKETKIKLSKSIVSEEMLSAKLIKSTDRIEEEMKLRELESIRHAKELGRQKVEASRSVRGLRLQLLEAERAAEVMEQSMKEMKERGLEAYEATEVNSKRFGNVLPIAEELYELLKMNVDDLVSVKDTFSGLGDPHACKPLELTTTTMRTPSSTEEAEA